MAPRTDWNPVLRAELDQPYWAELQTFVAGERQRHTVYPPTDEVFAALHLTPLAEWLRARLPESVAEEVNFVPVIRLELPAPSETPAQPAPVGG